MDDRRITAIANAMFSFGSILLAMLLVLFSVVEWFYAEAM